MDIETLARLTEEIILEDAEDEDTIQYRRTLLRIWPEPLTEDAKLKARDQIKNYREKIKFQQAATQRWEDKKNRKSQFEGMSKKQKSDKIRELAAKSRKK